MRRPLVGDFRPCTHGSVRSKRSPSAAAAGYYSLTHLLHREPGSPTAPARRCYAALYRKVYGNPLARYFKRVIGHAKREKIGILVPEDDVCRSARGDRGAGPEELHLLAP